MTAPPPEISKTKQRSEKRQTAFESLGEDLPKVSRSFFAKVKDDVTRGHLRSNFTIIRLRPAFSYKWRRSSWTIRVRRAQKKKTFDSPFTENSVVCSQIWPQVNGLASRGHVRSKWPNFEDFVFYHNLELQRSRQWFYHHCFQLFKTRRMMYNMTQKI